MVYTKKKQKKKKNKKIKLSKRIKSKKINEVIKYKRNGKELVASRRTQPLKKVASQRKTLRPGRRTQSKINP